MKHKSKISPTNNNLERRSLVKGLSTAVVAGIMVNAQTAGAQESGQKSGFQPMRHARDSWFAELPGVHRVFIDTSSPEGGADALRYASNILNAHGDAYAGTDADYAMVICYRHASTPFGYDDAIWEKYGEIFHTRMQYTDPDTGEAPKHNYLNVAKGPFAASTIPGVAGRGVHFAICNTATRGMAGMVAQETGGNADDIHAELVAGAIPNSRFVSAGVMATTRAQEYGYSLLYAG